MMRLATLRLSRGVSTLGAPDEWSRLQRKADLVMSVLALRGKTVSVAETSSGGLLSAALWSSPHAARVYKGGGVRLAYGISRSEDRRAVEVVRNSPYHVLGADLTRT